MQNKKTQDNGFLISEKKQITKNEIINFFKSYGNVGAGGNAIEVFINEIMEIALKCPDLFKNYLAGGTFENENEKKFTDLLKYAFGVEFEEKKKDFVLKLNSTRAYGSTHESKSHINLILNKINIVNQMLKIKIEQSLRMLKDFGIFDPQKHKVPLNVGNFISFVDWVFEEQAKENEIIEEKTEKQKKKKNEIIEVENKEVTQEEQAKEND